MNPILRRTSLVTATLCLAGLSPMAQADDGDGFTWVAGPYAWFAGINADLHLDNAPAGGINPDFEDILDHIDGAFEGHVEGQNDTWGMFADFTFLGLDDDHDFPAFQTNGNLDSRLFELAGVWSPGEDRFQGLDVFAGWRYLNVDMEVDFTPTDPAFADSSVGLSDTFNDFMVGARYTFDFSDRFGMTLRGDGSWGDTDGTWNASIMGHYKMKHGAWVLGYRYLNVGLDFEPGNAGLIDRHVDLDISGPIVGYGWKF